MAGVESLSGSQGSGSPAACPFRPERDYSSGWGVNERSAVTIAAFSRPFASGRLRDRDPSGSRASAAGPVLSHRAAPHTAALQEEKNDRFGPRRRYRWDGRLRENSRNQAASSGNCRTRPLGRPVARSVGRRIAEDGKDRRSGSRRTQRGVDVLSQVVIQEAGVRAHAALLPNLQSSIRSKPERGNISFCDK